MIPVDQEFLHSTEPDGERGDCFRACVASLLDVPREYVPHFMSRALEDRWFEELQSFLRPRELVYVRMGSEFLAWIPKGSHPLVIASGPSPRGPYRHAVVGELSWEGYRTVHDPHPSRAGLAGDPDAFGLFLQLWESSMGDTKPRLLGLPLDAVQDHKPEEA
jgi:hypothetical protein